MEINIDKIERLKLMKKRIWEDLQIERKIVMEDHGRYGREWEKSLRKYDELAIRYNQIKEIFDLLEIDQEQPNKVAD